MSAEAWARLEREDDVLRLVAGGDWVIAHTHAIEKTLTGPPAGEPRHVQVELAEVGAMDTAGAYLIARWLRHFAHQGSAIELRAANPAHEALIKRVEIAQRASLSRPRHSALAQLAFRVGAATLGFGKVARDLLGFFGLVCVTLVGTLLRPRRLRFVSVVAHIERIGLHALPILGLLSFLIGVVLAYQGADQLRYYGAEIFTVNLLGVSILRELGILLTAIMVAGRSGSAFTAEIGTMKVNEEVDAMRTLGLDPIEVLVLPRVIAMAIALPILTLYASLMALAGGAIMAMVELDIGLPQFLTQLREAITATTFWVGMVKAPVFAFLIALVGCFEGLQVSGSAESVGKHTTKAVVESIFLVIIADAAFSILFSALGI
jgi:phospholipid/cholesterol/gamma-HCH transport system permease protein